ncbi:hypothetical protein CLOBOL_06126 [Enterocloster bolteae ATCC BAA-613]|uniref:Uncharacterized protein n=1 Tax=Enterocloster bolteae (strain ATCC BAA-613 / DSM 15670 / CCUG 46953 / JCM 12243 / WAL 16351) TaxID=411902 RepID=A8S1Q0_ENTBW|nr:hypothetical protein CLOBOL_06126 [Enterocloster bolteae ATCC BAA-613]
MECPSVSNSAYVQIRTHFFINAVLIFLFYMVYHESNEPLH